MIRHNFRLGHLALLVLLLGGAVASNVQGAEPAQRAEKVLAQAAQDNQFTFIVFYKQNDATAQAMVKSIKQGMTGREAEAVLAFSQVTDPAEQALVKKFGLERTPMPMTLAVAPNGAITGIFNSKMTPDLVADAFVTPVMTRCMKSMQDGKVVLVCVHTTAKPTVPAAVSDFQKDPLYTDRSALIPLYVKDPAEARLLEQMQIDPTTAEDAVVILAPPGVLVGKFASSATKAEMAAALHKAGKCCDDPNCKHAK